MRLALTCLPRPPGFNGAMAVRPWMDVPKDWAASALPKLQWGHGREAMDGTRGTSMRLVGLASMGPWP